MAPYTAPSASSSQTTMHDSSAAVTQPKPARTAQPAPPMVGEVDNFFGASTVKKPKPSVPKPSKHAQQAMYDGAHARASSQGTLVPPPYEAPAHLAPTPKPATIARYLFFYGFLFPPFWIIGACILGSPLNTEPHPALQSLPKDVEAGYASPAYEKAEVAVARKTELVWAKRCLIAAISFTILLVVVIVAVKVTSK